MGGQVGGVGGAPGGAHLPATDEEEVIRIISARKATKRERRRYEQGA
ncbi:MAG: hypothetical protein ACYCQN_06145 [Acidiferrobacteraceae bacterium]